MWWGWQVRSREKWGRDQVRKCLPLCILAWVVGWEVGQHGQAWQGFDTLMARRVWPSDAECWKPLEPLHPSSCLLWGPNLSFEIRSHSQILFLGNGSLPFLQKNLYEGLGVITSLLKASKLIAKLILLFLVSALCCQSLVSWHLPEHILCQKFLLQNFSYSL